MNEPETTPDDGTDDTGGTDGTGQNLSFRQVRFCNNLLETGNILQSAKDAGLWPGRSDSATNHYCSVLLKKPYIAAYIVRARRQFLDAERITKPAIAQSLAWEAFADRTGIFDESGAVMLPGRWPDELKAIVLSFDAKKRIDLDTGEVSWEYKVRFANPTESKRILAEWRGMIGPKATVLDAAGSGGGRGDDRPGGCEGESDGSGVVTDSHESGNPPMEPDPRWAADRYRRAVAGESLLGVYGVKILGNAQWLRDRDELRLAMLHPQLDYDAGQMAAKNGRLAKAYCTRLAIEYLEIRKGF